MLKAFWFGLLISTAGAVAVQAQTDSSAGVDPAGKQKPTELLNQNYLTPTGETVPHPGVSQGAATTDLDRRIEQQNNRIEQSICSNCR